MFKSNYRLVFKWEQKTQIWEQMSFYRKIMCELRIHEKLFIASKHISRFKSHPRANPLLYLQSDKVHDEFMILDFVIQLGNPKNDKFVHATRPRHPRRLVWTKRRNGPNCSNYETLRSLMKVIFL